MGCAGLLLYASDHLGAESASVVLLLEKGQVLAYLSCSDEEKEAHIPGTGDQFAPTEGQTQSHYFLGQ